MMWRLPYPKTIYRVPHPNSMRARQHNALSGHLVRAGQFIELVLRLESTTPEAKQLAADIRPLLGDLHQALKVRVDP